MALKLENLIDLNLLSRYDENIKKYIAGEIAKIGENIIFTTKSELPITGKKNILYVTEDSVLVWTGNKYTDMSNPEPTTKATSWGFF